MLDEGACIYGAGVLLKHREALENEVKKVAEGGKDTPEGSSRPAAIRRS